MFDKLKKRKNIKLILVLGVLKKLVYVLVIFTSTLYAQKENKHIRSGNDKYYEENYKDAEVDYMRALEKNPESLKGQYNLGGALYKQENYEDATKLFSNIAAQDIAPEKKAQSFYNLGNSYLKAQKLDEAIASYKNSLRYDPDDLDAKYNLEYAKKMKQQQQEQQQNQDQNKDQEDKEDKQDQQKQDQQQQNEDQQEQKDNQDQQQQDQQQNKQDQQNQQQQQQPQQISKQDAERMLEALKNDENKTLEKVKLQKVQAQKAKSSEKDW
jgi:tetratricopeptide (TPR) repeat protein